MAKTAKTKHSFSSARRWVLCFNSILAVLALLALLAMANYLAGGYYKRFRLQSQSGVHLQPQTMRILNSLTEDVAVTIFFDPQDEEGYEKELYSLTTDLLREYHNVSPHISVTNLNYVQFQGQARELLARHKLTNLKDKDFVLFESHGHSKILYAKSLAQYDLASYISGKSKKLRYSEFLGEPLFTSAIFEVTHPQLLKACFLQGHGESQPDATSSENSYSKLATILKEETDTDWETLSLMGTNTIPADCQLLIIAGPCLVPFSKPEIEKIDDYLKQGNRLLLMLDNHFNSGIEDLLAKYGVSVSKTTVREQDKDYMLSADGSEFWAAQLQDHPTLNPIYAEHLTSLRFFAPRYFDTKGSSQTPGAPDVKDLIKTSPQAISGNERGAFPIAIAVEQGGIKGVNTPRGGTRIIAIGDSSLFSNQGIDMGANHIFASLALNWLLDRPEVLLSGISSTPIKEYKLMITEAQMRSIQLVFLGGVPGGVLFIGWLVWLRRRR